MKQALVRLAALAMFALASPSAAFAQQMQSVDPDTGAPWQPGEAPADERPLPPEPQSEWTPIDSPAAQAPVTQPGPPPAAAVDQTRAEATPTVPREDIFTAAENVFGQGAEGLGGILEDILKEQGEPIAYISGEEASGAFIIGARWGSGVMRHRVEGDRVVYWTGPFGRVSTSARMRARSSSSSTICTTRRSCSAATPAARAAPISWAGSQRRTCGAATSC
jgi:hypothetical protein